jgi:hypothetical protein
LWRFATTPFTTHPRDVGETYLEHGLFASRYGVKMTLGGVAALIHAVFPFLFEKTGSRITRELNETLEASVRRAAARRRDAV